MLFLIAKKSLSEAGTSNISSFAKSFELIAHEPCHGILYWMAGLEYRNQSGILNEHFADVLGTLITQHIEKSTADNADWLFTEKKNNKNALGVMKTPFTRSRFQSLFLTELYQITGLSLSGL